MATILLSTPFRLFFFLAAVLASLWMGTWSIVLHTGKELSGPLGTTGWHVHEMVFGYTGAVLAGFLLTAARNWTKRATLSGMPLLLLALLWAAGRVSLLSGASWSPLWPAVVDGLFWLLLAAALAIPIVGARSKRNYPFPVLLLILGAADVIVHLHVAGHLEPLWSARALPVALDAIALVILIFGGRILPMFTANAIEGQVARSKGWIDWLGLGLLSLLPVFHAAGLEEAGAVLSIAAGSINLMRLYGWGGSRTLDRSLIWVLHLGWALLCVALIAQGAVAFTRSVPPSLATHLFTVGGLGLLTIGMIVRVSLGHTGRALIAPRLASMAFLMVAVAALSRTIVPVLSPPLTPQAERVAGVLWALAFALVAVQFAPIWLSPRPDGKPG